MSWAANYNFKICEVSAFPNQKITITYHGDYVPSALEAADPELYASNVRAFLMRRTQRFCDVSYSFKDKLYFFGKINDFSQCSEQY